MALDTFLIILCRARGGWRSHCRRIALTIVDTPGFGDNIDNEFAFQEILGYLEREYDHVLVEESRIKRNPRFRDNRVHALLYFIPPTGHVLREIDIELMRRISLRVNLIPVGKADSLTPTELKVFKKRIMEDIEHYDIPVYNFPYEDEEDDEETIADNSELFATTTSSILMARSSADLPGALMAPTTFVTLSPCWISATNHPNYMVGDIIDVKLSMREYLDSQRGTKKTKRVRSGLQIPSQLAALDLPEFEGRRHSGIDDARNIARVVSELARRGFVLRANYTIRKGRRWPWMGRSPGQILPEYVPDIATSPTAVSKTADEW